MKLGQNVHLDEILDKVENESKTRSLGHILEEPCVRSRGQVFQSDYQKTWSECLSRRNLGQVRKWVMSDQILGQVLGKHCVHSRGYIFCPIIMKLGQNVWLDEISNDLENRLCLVKKRLPVQILEKPCVCSGGHIFSLIILKLGQNVCLDKISHKFENGSCRSKTR